MRWEKLGGDIQGGKSRGLLDYVKFKKPFRHLNENDKQTGTKFGVWEEFGTAGKDLGVIVSRPRNCF